MDIGEIRKLALLRADLIWAKALLIDGGPVGMTQYENRLNSIIQEIELNIQHYIDNEVSHLIDSDAKYQVTSEINDILDMAINDLTDTQTKLAVSRRR